MNNDSQLAQLKTVMMEILTAIDQLCCKYGLHYVLVGGSLLGAVRHHGFIPWDDDLDIAMPREDYQRFIQLSKDHLPFDLCFRNAETDQTHVLPFGKVCKKGTEYVTELDVGSDYHGEIFVDLFPLDHAQKATSALQTIQAYLVKGLKSVLIRRAKLNLERTSLIIRVLQILLAPFPSSTLHHLQQAIMQWNKNPSAEYYVNLGSNYNFKKQTIEKSRYFPEKKLPFEGVQFSVPNDYSYILDRIYGANYMQLPPEEKRISHNIVKLKLGR